MSKRKESSVLHELWFWFLMIFGLVTVVLIWLAFGNCQNSKYHYIFQRYYLPRYENGEFKDGFYLEKPDDYNGIWKAWYKNGQLMNELNFRDGFMDGLQREWNGNGELLCEAYFENGCNAKQIMYIDKNKKVVETFMVKWDGFEKKYIGWDGISDFPNKDIFEDSSWSYIEEGDKYPHQLSTDYFFGDSLHHTSFYDLDEKRKTIFFKDGKKIRVEYFKSSDEYCWDEIGDEIVKSVLLKTEYFKNDKKIKTKYFASIKTTKKDKEGLPFYKSILTKTETYKNGKLIKTELHN